MEIFILVNFFLYRMIKKKCKKKVFFIKYVSDVIIIVLFLVFFKVENYIFNSIIFNMIIVVYIVFKYYNNIFVYCVFEIENIVNINM